MINRSIKPLPNAEIEFSFPDKEVFTLKNGIKVHHIYKTELPVVSLKILFKGGSSIDPVGLKGLSHITSMMIDEGAGEYDAFELDAEFEKIGTGIGISTNQDNTTLQIITLEEYFERSLELLGMIINKPHFNAQAFEVEKLKLINRLKRKSDDPEYLAEKEFENLIFGQSGYGFPVMGVPEEIETIGNSDVKANYENVFNSGNCEVLCVGFIETTKLENALNKVFGEIKNGSPIAKPEITTNLEGRFMFLHKPNSTQSEVVMGHITEDRRHPDYTARKLANTILGGAFTSRLNSNLREEKGYTYGINSGLAFYKNASIFEIYTSVQSDKTADTVSEILKEIEGLKKHISEEELEFAKSYSIRRYPSLFETYSDLISYLNLMVVHNLNKEYFEQHLEELKSVTLDKVLSAAKFIDTSRLNIVVVGNKDTALQGFEEIQGLNLNIKD